MGSSHSALPGIAAPGAGVSTVSVRRRPVGGGAAATAPSAGDGGDTGRATVGDPSPPMRRAAGTGTAGGAAGRALRETPTD